MKLKYTYTLLILTSVLFLFSCKKEKEEIKEKEFGTVTDSDGNVYQTIKIGSQWWMMENLKTTKYRNGTYIKAIGADNNAWSTTTKGAYCVFDNNPDFVSTYGYLYNGYAVNDSNQLAPEGWHIPTDYDWKVLEKELGLTETEVSNLGWRGSDEGDKLKVEAPEKWTEVSPVWGSNESGFKALPGACRVFTGEIADPGIGAVAFWWSASSHESNELWYRSLDKKFSSIYRSHTYKNYGFSVRCVKD